MTSPSLAALLARFASLATKRGLLVSSLGDLDLALLMHSATRSFLQNEVYGEGQVNQTLKDWLADEGRMLRTDHVELRRTLIDLQFLARDGFGRAYTRPTIPPARFRDVVESIAQSDLTVIAREARDSFDRQRAARRAVFGPSATPTEGQASVTP
jgi:hypothetical protein